MWQQAYQKYMNDPLHVEKVALNLKAIVNVLKLTHKYQLTSWPTPNACYNFTLEKVFLEMTDDGELNKLWTPFGSVKLDTNFEHPESETGLLSSKTLTALKATFIVTDVSELFAQYNTAPYSSKFLVIEDPEKCTFANDDPIGRELLIIAELCKNYINPDSTLARVQFQTFYGKSLII